MSFSADTTVGTVQLINVLLVAGLQSREIYVPVRAAVSVDRGNLDREGAPRFEWSVNSLGMEPMRIGADSIEDLCRSCCYLVAVHLTHTKAIILPGQEGVYGVQLFSDDDLLEVGPGHPVNPDDKKPEESDD